MGKKKAAKTAKAVDRYQLAMRLTDADESEFRRAAELEGFQNIQSWMLEQARRRVRVLVTSIKENRYVAAEGRIIPFSDIRKVTWKNLNIDPPTGSEDNPDVSHPAVQLALTGLLPNGFDKQGQAEASLELDSPS